MKRIWSLFESVACSWVEHNEIHLSPLVHSRALVGTYRGEAVGQNSVCTDDQGTAFVDTERSSVLTETRGPGRFPQKK